MSGAIDRRGTIIITDELVISHQPQVLIMRDASRLLLGPHFDVVMKQLGLCRKRIEMQTRSVICLADHFMDPWHQHGLSELMCVSPCPAQFSVGKV